MRLCLLLFFLLLCGDIECLFVAKHVNDDDCSRSGLGCFPKKTTIPQVIQVDHCKNFYQIDRAVSVVPTQSIVTPIPPCLSCGMKLRTAHDNQTVTAIFYSLGINGGTGGRCQRIRLDIFDGWTPSDETRLTSKNGICGCDLPQHSFQSTNNTLTIRLSTSCFTRSFQFGTFEIVVAATNKEPGNCRGQFECGTGQCIDKVYVCDNHPQCPDRSDEIGCHGHHGNGIPAWLIVIFVIIAVALFVLFLVTMTLVCLKYVCAGVCYTGYTRV